MLGSAKSEHLELTNGEIIFDPTHVITIPQRHVRTDKRKDDFAVAIPRSA